MIIKNLLNSHNQFKMITVKLAKREDIKPIMQFQLELFRKWDSMDQIDKINKQWFLSKEHEEYVLETIKNKESDIFLAVDEIEIIGYLKCKIEIREPFLQKIGYMAEILIKPEYRGKRIGSKLNHEAIKWFKNKNLPWITVSTHSQDIEANSFWEKKGYKEFNKVFKKRL